MDALRLDLQALTVARDRLAEARQVLQDANIVAAPDSPSAANRTAAGSVAPLVDMAITQADAVIEALNLRLDSDN